jgi:lipopolysaccharide/colanic/teichoic acid biosynthesis glycosyltransferase
MSPKIGQYRTLAGYLADSVVAFCQFRRFEAHQTIILVGFLEIGANIGAVDFGGGGMTDKADTPEQFHLDYLDPGVSLPAPLVTWTPKYVLFKFVCDKSSAVLCLPYIICVGLVLWVLNPFLNPGPLLFSQNRMGMGGRRFTMWKFRTMSVAPVHARAHDAALETERISVFACYLRKLHIDELPNFISVLVGDMSLVGPRPDVWDHSTQYAANVLHYSDRFRVRPGITGLAQVRAGYADTTRAVKRKARLDRFYVQKSGIKLDLYIAWLTVGVFVSGFRVR